MTDGLAPAAFARFRRTGELYGKGILSEEDFIREMTGTLNGVFADFLKDARLELRLTASNYPRFAEGYREYLDGKRAGGPACTPWLRVAGSGSREASEDDERSFFRLMETFCVTPEYFEPAPEGVPVPDKVYIHEYNSSAVCGTRFRCADDGGLLTAEETAGKTFRLRNELGLEAALTVREDRRRGDRRGLDFDEVVLETGIGPAAVKAEFLAEGYIEGYTAPAARSGPEILIRPGAGGEKVFWLAYREDPADLEAHLSHPVWREYYRWREESEEKRLRLMEPFFDGFRPQGGR